jgi:hypothetical protein
VVSNTDGSTEPQVRFPGVRFFWTVGGDWGAEHSYCWLATCPRTAVAVWHGAELVVAGTPPADALDAEWVNADLAASYGGSMRPSEVGFEAASGSDRGRWVCSICAQFLPLPVAWPQDLSAKPCAACGCDQDMHTRWSGPFDTGCGMAWAEVDFGPDGEADQVAMRHCPCDGYQATDTPRLTWPRADPQVHDDGSQCVYGLRGDRASS